jgi:hypothetical protein
VTQGGRLVFDPDFLTAEDGAGNVKRFSRAERAVLRALAARPGVIFSRQSLLDAMSGDGSDSSDRNVDFVINRLRRKLGDAARAPRYIGTQYGEGYWWLPQDRPPDAGTARAFIVVGPLRAVSPARADDGRLRLFAETLRRHLAGQTPTDQPVVFDADCPDAAAFPGERPRYGVELDAFTAEGGLDCAVTVRDFSSGRVLHVSRVELDPTPATDDIGNLASGIVAAIWRGTAHRGDTPPAPDAEPLPIRMHRAGLLLTGSHSGVEVEQRLRAMLDADPDDHETRLMLATGIHSRFIMGGAAQFRANPNVPSAACDELERLVTVAVPHVQGDAIHTLAAAKLLYFLDRGHERIAVGMAEHALARSTAIVAALAVVGQMRQFEGDIEGGTELLDRALTMCAGSSVFTSYLHSIKLNGALATGRRDLIERSYEALLVATPGAGPYFELHCAGYIPADMPMALQERIAGHDAGEAAALARYSHFAQGRLFKRESHRANHARGVLLPLCRALGTGFVPNDIKRDLPSLFAAGGAIRAAV